MLLRGNVPAGLQEYLMLSTADTLIYTCKNCKKRVHTNAAVFRLSENKQIVPNTPFLPPDPWHRTPSGWVCSETCEALLSVYQVNR
jgi:hypothetical protein